MLLSSCSKIYFALLIVCASHGEQILAKDAQTQSADEIEFVVANTLLTVAHELGHVLIDEFSVPIFGSEEDAADTIATIGILIEDQHQPSSQLAARLLIAAQAWQLEWHLEQVEQDRVAYADDHPLGIQRAYRMICLVYGSAPDEFPTLAVELEGGNPLACVDEHRRKQSAVRGLIDAYGWPDGNAAHAQNIKVEYEEPASAQRGELLAALLSEQIVERTAAVVNSAFQLRRPITIAFANCAGPTAYWNPNRSEIVVCYGLLDYYAQMARLRGCLTEMPSDVEKCIRKRLDTGLPVPGK